MNSWQLLHRNYYLTVLELRGSKWISLSENQNVDRAVLLLEVLEESVSLPFRASRGHLHSLPWGLFLHLQSQLHSIFKTLTVTLLPSKKSPFD